MDGGDLVAFLATSEPCKLLIPLLLEGVVTLRRPQLQQVTQRVVWGRVPRYQIGVKSTRNTGMDGNAAIDPRYSVN